MSYYQIFLMESYMDSVLKLQTEGQRFTNLSDAQEFYRKRNYGSMARGSTEEHEEYKILEVRDRKLFPPNGKVPMKRIANTKSGDFILMKDETGGEVVGVITSTGEEMLTWRDD